MVVNGGYIDFMFMLIYLTVNCIICAMKKTFDAAMAMSRQSSGSGLNSAIRPVEIINRLRCKLLIISCGY